MHRSHERKIEKKTGEEIDVIIPAASPGRRMRSYKPKPLLKIGEELLIHRQLRILREELPSIGKTVLVKGFKADAIKNNIDDNLIQVENKSFYETNVLNSIGVGIKQLKATKRLLIFYGDLVFDSGTFSMLKDIDLGLSWLWIEGDQGLVPENEVGCHIQENVVSGMMWSFPNKWAQIAYLTGKELEHFIKCATNIKYKNYFPFEIFNSIIHCGGKLTPLYYNGNIVDIDTSKDLKKAKEIFK